MFHRYIGIDYSGAETPTSSLKALRVYQAAIAKPPEEVPPPQSARRYWTRRGIAEWLVERLSEAEPTLVGIDHAFSFPMRYFEKYELKADWPAFLEDFRRHWPTDGEHMYVDFVRDRVYGDGAARKGSSRWRRLTEAAAGAKSVFHFDVPGQVAKATHAGLPWLRFLRERLGDRVHFWPFDGWEVPAGRSVVAEAYPALWSREFPREDRNQDQHDAFSIAAWMRRADRDGSLARAFAPALSPEDRETASLEGWILGVAGTAVGERPPEAPKSPFLARPRSEWLASNDLAFAIADAFPVSPGHTLVVPRRQVASWFDATREEQRALLALVSVVRRRLERRKPRPDGYNIGINVGAAAGQTICHLHVHVIPRYGGDVPDPVGGVRNVIPGRGNYLKGPK